MERPDDVPSSIKGLQLAAAVRSENQGRGHAAILSLATDSGTTGARLRGGRRGRESPDHQVS